MTTNLATIYSLHLWQTFVRP